MATRAFWAFCWRVLVVPLRRLTIFALRQANSSEPPPRRGDAARQAAPPGAGAAPGGPPAHWLAYIRDRAPDLLAPDGSLITATGGAVPPRPASSRPGGAAERLAAPPGARPGGAERTLPPAPARPGPMAPPPLGAETRLRLPPSLARLFRPQAATTPRARPQPPNAPVPPNRRTANPAEPTAPSFPAVPPDRPWAERGIAAERIRSDRATGGRVGPGDEETVVPPQQTAIQGEPETGGVPRPMSATWLAGGPEPSTARERSTPPAPRESPPRQRRTVWTELPPAPGWSEASGSRRGDPGTPEARHAQRPPDPIGRRSVETVSNAPTAEPDRGTPAASQRWVWPEANPDVARPRTRPPDLAREPRPAAWTAAWPSTDPAGMHEEWPAPWPTLPDEEPPPGDETGAALRAWERLQRLDREQRGLGWSA
jgi:hypothetical protein